MPGAMVAPTLNVRVNPELDEMTQAREAAPSLQVVPMRGHDVRCATLPQEQPHPQAAARKLGIDPRLAAVQQSPVFEGLTLAESIEIIAVSQERRFLRRQTLFRQGEAVRNVSLLVTGQVKVTHITAGGDEVILMLSGPGEIVGGLGLGAGSVYPTTAKALQPCHALFWETRTFGALVERFPALQRNTVKILAERLHTVQERFSELATEKVAPRLARTLMRLITHIGRRAEGGVLIGLSREELAQMTGTTLFTVSRLLSQWEDLGMVAGRREAVLVCNPPRLSELAEAA